MRCWFIPWCVLSPCSCRPSLSCVLTVDFTFFYYDLCRCTSASLLCQDLGAIFGNFGKVLKASLITDDNGDSKGYGFINVREHQHTIFFPCLPQSNLSGRRDPRSLFFSYFFILFYRFRLFRRKVSQARTRDGIKFRWGKEKKKKKSDRITGDHMFSRNFHRLEKMSHGPLWI